MKNRKKMSRSLVSELQSISEQFQSDLSAAVETFVDDCHEASDDFAEEQADEFAVLEERLDEAMRFIKHKKLEKEFRSFSYAGRHRRVR